MVSYASFHKIESVKVTKKRKKEMERREEGEIPKEWEWRRGKKDSELLQMPHAYVCPCSFFSFFFLKLIHTTPPPEIISSFGFITAFSF